MLTRFIPTVLLGLAMLAPFAQAPGSPVSLLSKTYMPEITGDFDHFAYDLKRNRLFVSAEEHHSVEMFDLGRSKQLQSIVGFKTPLPLVFSPEKDELMVCEEGDSALILIGCFT